MEKAQLPLHALHQKSSLITINRAHILLHTILISLFLYQRLTQNDVVLSTLPSLFLFISELVLAFVWLSEQAFRWRPVNRSVFIHRLPKDESRLPALDVLICTADHEKEPTVEVMNTLISAMSLDYPIDKLHVYLSDDGGSHVTLEAMQEAWAFATWWVPFCRWFGVKCRCPMAFFQDENGEKMLCSDEFIRERSQLKEKYELFEQRVEVILANQQRRALDDNNKNNHPRLVQVINENCTDPSTMNPDCNSIPLLVYVAREKIPSYSHHFKAGALNVLLRVSGLLSNSPIVLVLDCDMYCNDSTSAKQAMCFYLDPQISPTLGFVQFPQRFHNLGKHPMYDYDFRLAYEVFLPGMDGLGIGPIMCGTGFYLNRKALYSGYVKGMDLVELRKTFGTSNQLITTLSQDVNPHDTKIGEFSKEVEVVAACSYDDKTKWGDGVGFYYYSISEDIFTGYFLHIRGWKSVYLNPKRSAFLGSSTTNLNDFLIQTTRWTTGLVEIGVSRFCPLLYPPSRRHLSLLHRCSWAWLHLFAMDFIPVWCLSVIPQLCLLHGIPIYSKVSTSIFPLLATLIFLSSQMKHLHEVLTAGGTLASWWNEQRTWILKMLTGQTYGFMDAVMKILGLKSTSFVPTNKVIDEAQAKRYHQGLYDFQTSNMFLVPIGSIVILNLVCFFIGLVRAMVVGNWDDMALQVVFTGFFVVMSKPIVEAMVVRKDKGRFPTSAIFVSLVFCSVLLMLGSLILVH